MRAPREIQARGSLCSSLSGKSGGRARVCVCNNNGYIEAMNFVLKRGDRRGRVVSEEMSRLSRMDEGGGYKKVI